MWQHPEVMPSDQVALDAVELRLEVMNPAADGKGSSSDSTFLVSQKELKPTSRVLGAGSHGVVQLCRWAPPKGFTRQCIALFEVLFVSTTY